MTLAQYEARWQAERASRPPEPDYDWNPQKEGFEHTPELGAHLLTLLRYAGYADARLVGSVAAGRMSLKDIDVLIPLDSKEEKRACVQRLRQLLNPSHMAQPRDLDGVGIVARPYGVIDIFFNDNHK